MLEVLDVVRLVALEAGDLTVVLYADDELSTCEIGEGYDVLGDLVGVLACALPVEVLVLLDRGEDLWGIGIDRLLHLSSVSFLTEYSSNVTP